MQSHSCKPTTMRKETPKVSLTFLKLLDEWGKQYIIWI